MEIKKGTGLIVTNLAADKVNAKVDYLDSGVYRVVIKPKRRKNKPSHKFGKNKVELSKLMKQDAICPICLNTDTRMMDACMSSPHCMVCTHNNIHSHCITVRQFKEDYKLTTKMSSETRYKKLHKKYPDHYWLGDKDGKKIKK